MLAFRAGQGGGALARSSMVCAVAVAEDGHGMGKAGGDMWAQLIKVRLKPGKDTAVVAGELRAAEQPSGHPADLLLGRSCGQRPVKPFPYLLAIIWTDPNPVFATCYARCATWMTTVQASPSLHRPQKSARHGVPGPRNPRSQLGLSQRDRGRSSGAEVRVSGGPDGTPGTC